MTRTTSKDLLCGTAFAALLSPAAALADPTASINLSWVFGEGAAIGVKAFSNDESGEVAATLGLDYLFSSRVLRPNAGVAYLEDDYFVGLDIGVLNNDWSSVNIGIGVGPFDGDDGSTTPAASSPPDEGGTGEGDTGEGSSEEGSVEDMYPEEGSVTDVSFSETTTGFGDES